MEVVDVQDFWQITNQSRGNLWNIFQINGREKKEKKKDHTTGKQVDLETLGFWPMLKLCSKISPDTDLGLFQQ